MPIQTPSRNLQGLLELVIPKFVLPIAQKLHVAIVKKE